MASLHLDQEAFQKACSGLDQKCSDLLELTKKIKDSFSQLQMDWDSEAGKLFFDRFQNDLIKNMENYAHVFEHMSQNLASASNQYQAVFDAADAVVDKQL